MMPLNFFETAFYKMRALTGKNSGHEIGTGLKTLAEDVETVFTKGGLILVPVAVNTKAQVGQFIEAQAPGLTITVPGAKGLAGSLIGIFSQAASTTVTSEEGNFVGDFVSGSSLTLAANQHVIFKSSGGTWMIIAGEPKREQKYSALTFYNLTAGSPIHEEVISTTRPAIITGFILPSYKGGEVPEATISVGGVLVLQASAKAESVRMPFTVFVPPGQSLKLERVSVEVSVEYGAVLL